MGRTGEAAILAEASSLQADVVSVRCGECGWSAVAGQRLETIRTGLGNCHRVRRQEDVRLGGQVPQMSATGELLDRRFLTSRCLRRAHDREAEQGKGFLPASRFCRKTLHMRR